MIHGDTGNFFQGHRQFDLGIVGKCTYKRLPYLDSRKVSFLQHCQECIMLRVILHLAKKYGFSGMSSGSQGWVNRAPIQPCDVLQYSIWLIRVCISYKRDNREAFFKKIEGLLMFICPENLCKLFGQINNWSCYSTEVR